MRETADRADEALARLALRADFGLQGPQAAGASERELGARLMASAMARQAPFRIEFCAVDGLI